MNAALQTLLIAAVSVAAAAALGVALADRTAAPANERLAVEPVVVVSPRSSLPASTSRVQLPRVVIEQCRVVPPARQLAQTDPLDRAL
jgi:hypothetical protein